MVPHGFCKYSQQFFFFKPEYSIGNTSGLGSLFGVLFQFDGGE
jgi:hypothetical protein